MTPRALVKMMQSVLCAGAIAACVLSGAARAQVYIEPPPEYIATVAPVYFEGHAAYWYGNRWYYRDGARWSYYHDEPRYLHDWRGGHREPYRKFYGRGHWGGYRHR